MLEISTDVSGNGWLTVAHPGTRLICEGALTPGVTGDGSVGVIGDFPEDVM